MDEAVFWHLIDGLDWRREGDDEAVIEPVIAALAALDDAEIESFEEILARLLHALDGRAWARRIGDGWWGGAIEVSADAFLYARCVVVANGRSFYEGVLRDPWRMPADLEFEALLSVAPMAWQRRTGHEADFLTAVSYETFANASGWPPAPPEPSVVRPVGPGYARAGADRGTRSYDHGKLAVRRLIRDLVTGALRDPLLDAHLTATGRRLVMTPGGGVVPETPEPERRGALWLAPIRLWSAAPDTPPEPTGLVAWIELERKSPFEVRGRLVRVARQGESAESG
jgi:hypothetical protein